MTRDEEIQQLLSSVSGILDDAMEHMDFNFNYVIITAYPENPESHKNQLMSNVYQESLERLLLDAIKAAHLGDMEVLDKGNHLN